MTLPEICAFVVIAFMLPVAVTSAYIMIREIKRGG